MLYLVTGGSGSGKSEYAENLVQRLCQKTGNPEKEYADWETMDPAQERSQEKKGNEVWYIATMIPYGTETEKKITRHRRMRRDKGFLTKECYLDLKGFVERAAQEGSRPSCVLLECMSNLTANEMFEKAGAGNGTFEAVREGIEALCGFCGNVVVVTNEVCSETAKDSPEMCQYKKVLGNINCWIAARADQVTEVVYGVPASVKTAKKGSVREKECLMKTEKKRSGLHLIIGGAFQGKTEYAKRIYPDVQWCDGTVCDLDAVWKAEGILHLEGWIRRWMRAGRTKEELAKRLLNTNSDRVIVCTEIGYGLVPIDAFDREYRETVGRICTKLGKNARQVDRIVCGIKTTIKQ